MSQTLNPLTQQIYNYESPTGNLANTSGTYNPANANINTAYTGPQTQNPYQPTYMQTPVQGQASTFAGAQLGQGVNPYLMQQFSGQNLLGQAQGSVGGNLASTLNPQAAEQQLLNAWQPAQAQSTRSLNDSLAAMGLQGGPALNAQSQLQNSLNSSLGNSLAGLIQGSQGNMLSLYGQNLGALNSGNSNQLGLLNTQAGLNQQTGLANQSAINSMTGQNLSNLYGTNQYNATAANDASAQYAQALQNAYAQNLGNFQSMNAAGYGTSANLAGQAMGGSQSLAGQFYNYQPTQQFYNSEQQALQGAYSNLGAGAAGGA